jgi:hypothetical protein
LYRRTFPRSGGFPWTGRVPGHALPKVFALEAGILNETRDAVDAPPTRGGDLLSGAKKKVLVVGTSPTPASLLRGVFWGS